MSLGKTEARAFVSLLAASLIFCLPAFALLRAGYVGSMDLHFYSRALALFADDLRMGELHPLFLAQADGGLGSPVFLYYPPLAFYLSAPWKILFPFTADNALIASLTLANFCSGLACYGWLRARLPAKTALAGALIYALWPYRLVYLYFDFSPAQGWALVFIPLVFACLDRLGAGKSFALAETALALFLLLLTHIPSFICLLPVASFYLLARTGKLSTLAQFSAACLLALSLGGFYLVPVLANRRHAHFESAAFSGYFDYHRHFASPDFWIALPFILAGIFWLYRKKAGERGMKPLILAGLLMMTPLSLPLWEQVAPLSILQFPVKRFFAPLLAILALESAFLLPLLSRPWRLLIALFVFLHLSYTVLSYRHEGWPAPVTPALAEQEASLARTNKILPFEYRTQWTPLEALTLAALERTLPEALASATQGNASLHVADWRERSILLEAQVTSEKATILLHRLYFPGWQAPAPATLAPDSGSGRIALTLPRGAWRVTLHFAPLGLVFGTRLSLLAACLLVGMMLWSAKRKSHDHLHQKA